MDAALDVRWQEFFTAGDHLFGVSELFHLDTQHRIDDGQIIGGVGEGQRLVGTVLIHRLLERAVRLGNNIIGALNGSKSD